MKDNAINETVQRALRTPSPNFVAEAVNRLLGEDIESGNTVAIIDDPSYPYQGVTGKVKGPSAKGSGFVDVSLPDGNVLPMQASLLLKC